MEHPRFEPVPHQWLSNNNNPTNCIPIFAVKQKGKGRLVFDAAAKTNDMCLNDTLYQGPDRNNSLRGVVLRFRKHPIAVTADIENMFHNIAVPEKHRDSMRFFWFQDNNPDKPLIEYRSKVHLQGLRSSPPIANLTVRYASRSKPPTNGNNWITKDDLLDPYQPNQTRIPDDIQRKLTNQFYVDDFMASKPT